MKNKKSKARLLNRLLGALYALAGALVTLFVVIGLCAGMKVSLGGYQIGLGEGLMPAVVLVLIGLVLIAWPLYLVRAAFPRKKAADKGSVSVQSSEAGDVRVSLDAVETLVHQAIGQADGVEEIKTAIVNHEDSISVNVDMTLRSDVHIPNVTMLMQRSIKNFIEEYSGIAVRDVTVMVTNILETPLSPQSPSSPIQAQPMKAVEAPQAQEPLAEEASPLQEKEIPEETPEEILPEEPFEEAPLEAEIVEEPLEEASLTQETETAQEEAAPGETTEEEEFSEKDIW